MTPKAVVFKRGRASALALTGLFPEQMSFATLADRHSIAPGESEGTRLDC